jgi:hypothetical protein
MFACRIVIALWQRPSRPVPNWVRYAYAECREGEDRIAGYDPRVMFYSRGPISQDPNFGGRICNSFKMKINTDWALRQYI